MFFQLIQLCEEHSYLYEFGDACRLIRLLKSSGSHQLNEDAFSIGSAKGLQNFDTLLLGEIPEFCHQPLIVIFCLLLRQIFAELAQNLDTSFKSSLAQPHNRLAGGSEYALG